MRYNTILVEMLNFVGKHPTTTLKSFSTYFQPTKAEINGTLNFLIIFRLGTTYTIKSTYKELLS